ncbi:DUF5825 family protein [Streptomyces sp. NPDC001406]|uniref:DUF5825 family protein n=1 Tax=Streptomyces sp. NPDC001406 TaxID=3364572 RepID=UPI0036A10A02
MTGPPAAVPHRVTGRRVEVTEPLRLGAGGQRTALAVQFLRECQSLGLRVSWTAADGEAPYDIGLLRHLPPPAQVSDEPGELKEWRAGYAYGMLYHRRGPDFVAVMDRREPGTAVRLTLDHPDLLSAFHTLLNPTPLHELDPGPREAAGLLAAERLALVTDGWAVALPPRISRWPVPCTGI